MKSLGSIIFLLLFVSSNAFSDPVLSKDWYWDITTEGYVYAATNNSKERVLGQYCYFNMDSCIYIVTLGITCDEGDEHP